MSDLSFALMNLAEKAKRLEKNEEEWSGAYDRMLACKNREIATLTKVLSESEAREQTYRMTATKVDGSVALARLVERLERLEQAMGLV